MPATYVQFRDDLLMALARKTNQLGRNVFDYDEVADEAGLSRNQGWTEMAASQFRDMGYAMDASDGDEFAGALNGLGMQEAERLMGAVEKTVDMDHGAPEFRRRRQRSTLLRRLCSRATTTHPRSLRTAISV